MIPFKEVPTPIEPQRVIAETLNPEILASQPILEAAILATGQMVYLIHDFHHNFAHPSVAAALQEVTGYSANQVHDLVESLAPYDRTKPRATGNVFAGRGGDSLNLDSKRRGKNVETMAVGNRTLPNGETAEFAFVRMWDYGELKRLTLPEGNPGKQVEWELSIALKGKPLSIVVPKNVVENDGNEVTLDNGVLLEMKPGDAVISRLVPRQIISASPKASQEKTGSGSKYLVIGPEWDTPTGIQQKPVYWKNQMVTPARV